VLNLFAFRAQNPRQQSVYLAVYPADASGPFPAAILFILPPPFGHLCKVKTTGCDTGLEQQRP
jgi:hypothetical protein